MGVVEIIAAVVLLIIGALGGGFVGNKLGTRQAKQEAQKDAELMDRRRAQGLTDDLDRDLPDRVRDMDGRGFRDD